MEGNLTTVTGEKISGDTIEIRLTENANLKAQVVELEKRIDALENYLIRLKHSGNPHIEPLVGYHMHRKNNEYIKRHPMGGECLVM